MMYAAFRSLIFLSALTVPSTSWACSVGHLTTPVELVSGADIIVRVTALEYQISPANKGIWTSGVPDSVVKFQVLETIRGKAPSTLTMHGYLTQRNDFNDQPSPYTFVRPGGRAGSCFANSYRQGAEYLLFLKKDERSQELTPNWAALAPVNEQLHNDQDPWLLWVRNQAK